MRSATARPAPDTVAISTRSFAKESITALGFSILALACAGQPSETEEIVDNLILAGVPPQDIQIADNGVYLGGDAQVSLAASREMLVASASDRTNDTALKTLWPPIMNDILWRNIGSGEVTLWLMNGTSISSQVPVAGAGVVGLDWQIQGVGKFNSDDDSDILWRNNSGEVELWLMNGAFASATTVAAGGVVGPEWQIHGVGDFNADFKSDILWQNLTTSEVKVWLMSGGTISAATTVTAPGVVEAEWEIRGIGDFNGDLKGDILWRNNSTSEVKVWLMDGASITSTPVVTGPGVTELAWQSQGVGDFDHDGKSDIMWRNTSSGEVKVWLMNGGSISAATTVVGPGVVGQEWQIDSIGDFNGNGSRDLLWRNDLNGEVKIWLMNGATIASQGTVTGPGVVGLDWQIQGAGDFGPHIP